MRVKDLKEEQKKYQEMLRNQNETNNMGIVNAHRIEGILVFLDEQIKKLETKDVHTGRDNK